MAKRKAGRAGAKTAGGGRKAAGRKGGSARKAASRASSGRAAKASKKTARKAARPAARKAAKTAKRTAPKGARKATARKAAVRKAPARTAARKQAAAPRRSAAPPARKRAAGKVAVTVPVRPSARAQGAQSKLEGRKAPALNRERRVIQDDDIIQSTPPSSLDLDRTASAARSGRKSLRDRYDEHTETSPALTGGDVDADWESASTVGDEAPGGDNPTPDQDIVDDIGRALGVEYQDNEELKGADKLTQRDKNRWELDPASSDDWDDR